jgi:hypothetical protein
MALKQVSRVRTALLATSVLCICAPALAQTPASQPATAFGQEVPQQYLFNKMMSPRSWGQAPAPGEAGAAKNSAQGAPAAGAAAQAANEDDDDGPGPYPKKYLLNRIFNW